MRLLLGYILSICFFHFISAQDVGVIRQAALEALENYDVPGFSVGIIKDGEVIMSEGYGVNKINTNVPVDGGTLYAIASNTKAFIATALAKLDKEGKLDLDDPVQKYLPYFELYNEYVSQHTTVRDLLCHRVGLGTFSGDAIWYKSEKSPEQIIRQIKHLPAAYSWRGGYGYTNLMFITAGEVIKAVSGQTWSAYIQQHFLGPLDMSRTQTSVGTLGGLDNIATPHVTHRDNLPIDMANWDTPGAAGGILSSTDDMLKWMQVQLDPDVAEEKNIFPKAARNTCMTPHNPLNRNNFYSAGLGWFIYHREGHTVVTHGGGYDGMYSRVILVPDQKLGIVVLSNSMTSLPARLANYIRDTYLDIDTEGWLAQAAESEESSRKQWAEKFVKAHEHRDLDTNPTISKSQMVGAYQDPLYGEITIDLSDDHLELHFTHAPSLSASLSHWHYDTWKLDWKEEHAWFDFGTVQFLLDNNREVKGLEFYVPNDDIFFEEIKVLKDSTD